MDLRRQESSFFGGHGTKCEEHKIGSYCPSSIDVPVSITASSSDGVSWIRPDTNSPEHFSHQDLDEIISDIKKVEKCQDVDSSVQRLTNVDSVHVVFRDELPILKLYRELLSQVDEQDHVAFRKEAIRVLKDLLNDENSDDEVSSESL